MDGDDPGEVEAGGKLSVGVETSIVRFLSLFLLPAGVVSTSLRSDWKKLGTGRLSF